MTDDAPSEPHTWHYGLVARWWAEFNRGGPGIDFFRPFVAAGQPRRDGDVVEDEHHAIAITLYTAMPIEEMLAATGFMDVETRDGYTERPGSRDSDTVVFIAGRAA